MTDTMAERPKNYEPKEIEPRWYAEWTARGYFHADAAAPKAPFVDRHSAPERHRLAAHGPRARHHRRGHLHALAADGRPTTPCGCPGTDHAGIATQMVVERELREKEKKSRHDIGRAAFVERVWEWRQRTGDRILEQLKRLGARSTGTRTIFTMDPAVLGGGHRGLRSPPRRGADLPRAAPDQLVPVVSDGAVRSRGRSTTRGRRASCTSSRTRWRTARARWWWRRRGPETMLGDTAIAVHPDDPRHKGKIGKMVRAPAVAARVPDHRRRDPGRSEVRHRRGQGDAGARSERLRDRPAPQAADDLDLRRRGRDQRRGRLVRRPGPVRGAQAGQGEAEGARARARLASPRSRRRSLRALRDDRRADAVDAVVREDGAARQAGHRGGGAGEDQVRPRGVDEDVLPLDAQHPRLVHLAAAVVGAPHPGVDLRQVQRDHGGADHPGGVREVRRRPARPRTRTCWTPGSRRGCGRSRRSAGPPRPAS